MRDADEIAHFKRALMKLSVKIGHSSEALFRLMALNDIEDIRFAKRTLGEIKKQRAADEARRRGRK